MNRKKICIAVIALAFFAVTPKANASVFGEIQNNFTQVFNKIFKITGFTVSEKKETGEMPRADMLFQGGNKETAVGPGGAIYTITGGEGFPVFEKELAVIPAHSETDKPQTFTIWVKDPSGVAIVKAIVDTDKGEKEVILKLSDGNIEEGRWKGSWNAESVQAGQYYKVLFQAVGKSGGKAEMPFLAKAKTK